MNEELSKQIEAMTASIEAEKATPVTEEVVVATEEAPVETIEDKAKAMGWNPDHKGAGFVSAQEFVARGSFFRKIDALNKKIEDYGSVIKNLDEHNRKVAEAAYKKGVKDALDRRAEAVKEGDIMAFQQAESELNELEKSKPAVTQVKSAEVTQAMRDWAEANKTWFNNSSPENVRMVTEADGLFMLEKQYNPNLSETEILDIVTDKIKRLHPDKFVNPNKEKPMAVTKGSTTTTTGKVGLSGRLSDQQLSNFNQAKRLGVKMTIEDYAKQLDLIGALKDE